MYIILMFQICHFHYWLSKCMKSDRCRSTAGCPHTELSSLAQRWNSISVLCGCHPGNEKLQTKNLPWEFIFYNKIVCFPGKKIMSVENFWLQTAQDIPMNASVMIAWEAFSTSIFLWVISSCQSQAWRAETLRNCCKAQTAWSGWWWCLGPGPY